LRIKNAFKALQGAFTIEMRDAMHEDAEGGGGAPWMETAATVTQAEDL